MIVASLFGDLAEAQNLQALIDNSLPALYAQTDWRTYLDWGVPQIELTFETAIGRARIEAMASIVDIDANAPERSRPALERLKGKIPTMKEAYTLNQMDYRKILSLQNLPISDEAKLNALISQLYNDVQNAATSTDKRIDYMFYQAVSTLAIDVSITNNPDGIAFGVVDLLAKATQKRTVKKVWSDTSADGFQDITDVVNYAAALGRKFKEIWIEQQQWMVFKSLPSVKNSIFNPTAARQTLVTLDVVNEYLTANGLPPFRIINKRQTIEKDGVLQVLNPFKVENLAFIPDGKLGTVHNAISIESLEPVEGISYATYDRTLVAKWRDNNPWKEYTQCELNAFPSLESIDGIYILQTDVPTV